MQVAAYTPASGSLTGTVGSVSSNGYLGGTTGGSGTHSDWTITKERLWFANGVGVAYIDTFKDLGTSYTYISQTAGIEDLVAFGGTWPTSGNPAVTSEDRPFWPVPAIPHARAGMASLATAPTTPSRSARAPTSPTTPSRPAIGSRRRTKAARPISPPLAVAWERRLTATSQAGHPSPTNRLSKAPSRSRTAMLSSRPWEPARSNATRAAQGEPGPM